MVYLASQSPRRRELLAQIGIAFHVVDVDVAEVRAYDESPETYVRRVARAKAIAGTQVLKEVADAVVLGADTEVVLDGEVFGKPADAAHAAAMLRRLSGCTHRAMSAICCLGAGREESALSVTEVEFATLSDAQIAAYVASGEPVGRAGAYAIQGRAAMFVNRLCGSYSGVVGLPLHETAAQLAHFGIFPSFAA